METKLVRITKQLHKTLKTLAVKEERSMQEIINDAVESYLGKATIEGKAKVCGKATIDYNKITDDDYDGLMRQDEEMHSDDNNRSTVNYKGVEIDDFDF